MKQVILLLALGSLSSSLVLPSATEWELFKVKYNKVYDSFTEEMKHRDIFMSTLKTVTEHNQLADRGLSTFRMAINKFADIDDLVPRHHVLKHGGVDISHQYIQDGPVPDSVDWREKGVVTPVRDQGKCGASWAVEAAGALESQVALSTKKLVPLSYQQLVDCDTQSLGCDGGTTEWGYQYIIKNKGIDTDASYPYIANQTECKYDPTKSGATMTSYKKISNGDENVLKKFVASVGPIAAAISTSQTFQNYKSGVMDYPDCFPAPNHAVLIVGYGTENGTDYWLIRNDWGTDWGIEGYGKMARNKGNQCVIASYAIWPIL